MRVTTHAGGARDGETLLGTDNVHNTLPLVAHSKVRQPKLLHVLLESHYLCVSKEVDTIRGMRNGGLTMRQHTHAAKAAPTMQARVHAL